MQLQFTAIEIRKDSLKLRVITSALNYIVITICSAHVLSTPIANEPLKYGGPPKLMQNASSRHHLRSIQCVKNAPQSRVDSHMSYPRFCNDHGMSYCECQERRHICKSIPPYFEHWELGARGLPWL